jgi:hypothetical protein
MQENVARRPRFKRVTISDPIRLTDRDKAILSAVRKYRLLTTSQILSLVPGSRQNIVRRLQLLYHAGFLDRPKTQLPLRYTGELFELAYAPTRKAATVTAAADGETASGKECKPISSLSVAHTLSVSEALISIETACKLSGIQFFDEQAILDSVSSKESTRRLQWRVTVKSGSESEEVGVIPDAVFAAERQGDSGAFRRFYYFLEVDRGTMPLTRKSLAQSSIHRKALAYSRSFKSGILKRRFGIPGFKVLFVVRSKDRLERMREVCRTVQGSGSSLFLFVIHDEMRTRAQEILRCMV